MKRLSRDQYTTTLDRKVAPKLVVESAYFKQGLEVETSAPEQLAGLIQREVAQNIALARNAGIEKQ